MEKLSKEEQEAYEEELDYSDSMKNISSEEELAERRETLRNPTPNNPNPAERDSQQRKAAQAERELRELEESQPNTPSEREDRSDEVEYYRKQHPKLSTRDKLYKIKSGIKNAVNAGVSATKESLKKDVGEFVNPKPKEAKPLTQSDLNKALRESKVKGKQTKGQYHSPTYRGFPGGNNKPGGDPFAGMGMPGGSGRHASALPGGGSNAIRMYPFAGLGGMGRSQAPARQNVGKIQAAPRRPAPSPKPTRMKFPDPFAGLKSAGGSRMPKFDAQKDVAKGIGGAARSLGLGTGKKSAKKLRNVRDWMNF